MSANVSTPLETLISFSDYKNEKIKSIQLNLDDNMCMVVTNCECGDSTGITVTLKDLITDNVEISGFVKGDKLQSLIKILNIMYRQSIKNTSNDSTSSKC